MTQRKPSQYDWAKALFNDRRLSKNFTRPRRGKISHVTLHHMTIVAPSNQPQSTVAVEGAYDTWMGGRAASANYGVSGELVWQYVSDYDAAWSDANSTSNNSTLSIEHANSTAGPSWKISDDTMRTGARLVATLHRLYGLGRPSRKTVRVHRDYYATACPGPYMMDHLDDYIEQAQKFYDGASKPKPEPAPKPKSVTFRIGTLNIPLDAAKLPNGAERVKWAAKAAHDANLHVLACQEIDRGYKGDTWYYARLVLMALRVHDKTWKIVKPTLPLNENVTFYRSSKASLKRSLPDVVLSSPAGGRHASCSTYTIDGRTVAVRNTHLVQGGDNGASREQQGKELAAISGGGTIILGDFNQAVLPKALAKTHKTARDNAKASTNGDYGTHAKWGSSKASKDDASKLDHIVVPKAAVVNRYTVVGIGPDGVLTEPVFSDHRLVIASVTYPA